jgi:hypothetical protein
MPVCSVYTRACSRYACQDRGRQRARVESPQKVVLGHKLAVGLKHGTASRERNVDQTSPAATAPGAAGEPWAGVGVGAAKKNGL